MSGEFINVHTYDGKLKDLFVQKKRYTIQEKKKDFSLLLELLTIPSAIETLKVMITDLDNIKGSNYQKENNIDSSDILIELFQIVDNNDLLKLLDEQLADTRNLGICPSGRCTRLLQLWLAFC
jgi:hypothetical protein